MPFASETAHVTGGGFSGSRLPAGGGHELSGLGIELAERRTDALREEGLGRSKGINPAEIGDTSEIGGHGRLPGGFIAFTMNRFTRRE